MNATKWSSLTEFAKYLGREGMCRVEENDKGIHISWIDTSPEALKRQEALRRKEAQDKGDEEWERRILNEQIKRAQRDAEARGAQPAARNDAEDRGLPRQDGEKIKLSFGLKPTSSKKQEPGTPLERPDTTGEAPPADPEKAENIDGSSSGDQPASTKPADAQPLSLKMGIKPQVKNVFAQKNALAGGSKKKMVEQPKKMSEAERIMREEMERKRGRESSGVFGRSNKKQKV